MVVIGGLTDQTIYLIWSQISGLFSISDPTLANFFPYQYYFRNLINPLVSNQPISALVFSVFLSLVGKNGFNILILLTIGANFLFSYVYFKKYKLGFMYALLFSFSSYFWIHVGVHIALMQIWVFPIFFYALSEHKKFSIRYAIFIGLLLGVIAGVSNYYGFFLLIFFSLYVITKILIELVVERCFLKSLFQFYFISILIAIMSIGLLLVPYFKNQYFSPELNQKQKIERTLEDFVAFSSRPWYFFTPPVKNPFIGSISEGFISKLKTTKYFLADDYFPNEHSGNYFGLFFLISFSIVVIYTYVKGEKNLKKEIGTLFFVGLAVFLLMMPPFLTVFGFKFYTPGFLVYRFFPMFRVTARMGILLLIIVLTTFAISFEFVFNTFQDKKLLLKGFLAVLVVATLLEVFVPVKILWYQGSPAVYKYLRESTPVGSKFVIYPYHKTKEAEFWIPEHKRLLVNIRDYTYQDFDSEHFTYDLGLGKNISELKREGIDYLVVYKEGSSDEILLFQNSPFLNQIEDIGGYLIFSTR